MSRLQFCLLGFFLLLSAVGAGHAQTITTLYTFPSSTGGGSMLEGPDGNYYGIFEASGVNSAFLLTPTGTFATIYTFPSAAGQAELCLTTPSGQLLGFTDTNAFLLSLNGQYTSLATVPEMPVCPITGSDGNYYGVSGPSNGVGTYNEGALYQLTPAGSFQYFYSFTGKADGSHPSTLVEGSDGNLYGLDTAGTQFDIHQFFRYSAETGLVAWELNADDGGELYLQGDVVEGSTGDFYFDLDEYDVSGDYVLLQMTSTGAYSSVYSLPYPDTMIRTWVGGDGNIYFLEIDSGSLNIECVTVSGSVCNIYYPAYTFTSGDAVYPQLLQDGTGNVFGTVSLCTEGCLQESDIALRFTGAGVTPAISFTLTPSHVLPGGHATLTWVVNNAFSLDRQQCYAYGGWSGKQALSGTLSITAPSSAGTTTYSLICGGTEVAVATLTAGNADITLSASPIAPIYGTPVTLTAQIASGNVAPTGNIVFQSGTQTIASVPLNSTGGATYAASPTGLPSGTYQVTAKYAGDSHYGSSVSNSVAVTIVAPPWVTVASASISPEDPIVGQTVDFYAQAQWKSATHPATGTITLFDGSTLLASKTVTASPDTYASGATFAFSTAGFSPGTYSITAKYSGDTYNLPSSVTLPVTLAYPAVTVSASPNPVPANASTVLTAVVPSGGEGTATGTVLFYAGSQELASAPVNSSGDAVITLPAGTLAEGSYQLTAQYEGDAKHPAGTSVAVTLTVD